MGKYCNSHRLKTEPVGTDNPKYSTIDADLYKNKEKDNMELGRSKYKSSTYQTLNNLPSRNNFKL